MGENRLLTPCNCRLRAVSLFSWSVEQNARDTKLTTRLRARALPLLNLKKKRDCLQSIVIVNRMAATVYERDDCSHFSSFRTMHSPLSELNTGNRGTSYAKSGKGDLPEAKPAHLGEIPLNHEGNTTNNGIKFLQLLRQGQCREDYAG